LRATDTARAPECAGSALVKHRPPPSAVSGASIIEQGKASVDWCEAPLAVMSRRQVWRAVVKKRALDLTRAWEGC